MNELNYMFIVGAQKAGTTALYGYLKRHPRIVGGETKELGFFSRDLKYSDGNDYRSLFKPNKRQTLAMDATPEYLYYRRSPERIHQFAPNAKFVILLREPVSRAFSAFNMYHQICTSGWFKQRFEAMNPDAKEFYRPIMEGKAKPDVKYFLDREFEIIDSNGDAEEPGIVRRGIYAPQLERYVSLFGRENILIMFSDELKKDTKNAVNKVLEFAGLGPLKGDDYAPRHVREYTVQQGGKELIAERAGKLFAADKKILTETYGLDVPW